MSTTDSTQHDLTEKQQAYVDGLRHLADLLEANPDLIGPIPYRGYVGFHEWNCEDIPAAMATAVRRAGGRWAKEEGPDGDYFQLVRRFGPHSLVLYTARKNVCERVVVGTETVTREVPDPEQAAAIPMVTLTEEVERVEWICPPSLLSGEEDRP